MATKKDLAMSFSWNNRLTNKHIFFKQSKFISDFNEYIFEKEKCFSENFKIINNLFSDILNKSKYNEDYRFIFYKFLSNGDNSYLIHLMQGVNFKGNNEAIILIINDFLKK